MSSAPLHKRQSALWDRAGWRSGGRHHALIEINLAIANGSPGPNAPRGASVKPTPRHSVGQLLVPIFPWKQWRDCRFSGWSQLIEEILQLTCGPLRFVRANKMRPNVDWMPESGRFNADICDRPTQRSQHRLCDKRLTCVQRPHFHRVTAPAWRFDPRVGSCSFSC